MGPDGPRWAGSSFALWLMPLFFSSEATVYPVQATARPTRTVVLALQMHAPQPLASHDGLVVVRVTSN
ncbi:hypothetical protein CPLU01_10072 [Colletotrichum plurivorum]|uniref:Secreted protein n=1 Tax=Colletotrichum plurivorum TaxID=2175906 RepID=A0A8H6K653_9PEZI|nr:hypothetical protein CPLU01_10072 [Colletotrichum plurivorum]